MKEFAKTGSLFAGVTVITTVVSVAQTKFIALVLGPSATGLSSVITNFLQILTLFATLNLSVSASKYISEYQSEGRTAHLHYAYQFCVRYVAVASVCCFLLIVILSRRVTLFLFENLNYREYVILMAATLLFSASGVYLSSLQGLFERRAIAMVQVGAALLGLVSVVILVPLLSLRGYFISLVLIAFFTFAFGYFALSKRLRREGETSLSPSEKKGVKRKLLTFSGSNLLLIIVHPLSFFIIRYSILHALGADGVGLYAACLSVSTLIFGIVQVNPYYYFPKMNTAMPAEERVRLINEFLRFSLMILPPLMIGIVLLPDLVVLILYSGKFLPIVGYLSLFVIAEFANNMAAVFAVPVVGLTKLRFHVIWTFCYYVIWSTGSVWTFHHWGLRGLALMSLVAYSVWGTGYYVYLKAQIPLRIDNRNRRMALVVLAGIIGSFLAVTFVPSVMIRMAICVAAVSGSIFLLDRSERGKIADYAQSFLGRFRFSN